jgi:hypothetical protein
LRSRGAAGRVGRTAPGVKSYLQQAPPLQQAEPLQQDALALLSATGLISNRAATIESKIFFIAILLKAIYQLNFDCRASRLRLREACVPDLQKSRGELFLDPETAECEEAAGLGERSCRLNQSRMARVLEHLRRRLNLAA